VKYCTGIVSLCQAWPRKTTSWTATEPPSFSYDEFGRVIQTIVSPRVMDVDLSTDVNWAMLAKIFKPSRFTDPMRTWKQSKEQVPALPFIVLGKPSIKSRAQLAIASRLAGRQSKNSAASSYTSDYRVD